MKAKCRFSLIMGLSVLQAQAAERNVSKAAFPGIITYFHEKEQGKFFIAQFLEKQNSFFSWIKMTQVPEGLVQQMAGGDKARSDFFKVQELYESQEGEQVKSAS